MKKEDYIGFRTTKEETARLKALAGGMSIPEYLLITAFTNERQRGNQTQYPGWEIEERGRRDRGIKISREPTPSGMESPVLLYPEDREWQRFNDM